MKDVESNRLESAEIAKVSARIVLENTYESLTEKKYITQTGYVPLSPTETGRRRHNAHQLQAPKFLQTLLECQQSQHTEMYLG